MVERMKTSPAKTNQKLNPNSEVSSNVQRVLNIDLERDRIYSARISQIGIPIDPSWEYYRFLWELLEAENQSLARSFNCFGLQKNGWKILWNLFSLPVNYWLMNDISKNKKIQVDEKYPYPNRLTKKSSEQVKKQIQWITQFPLFTYEWKSIQELLCGANCTQTFWDFAITCLKNWIQLKA